MIPKTLMGEWFLIIEKELLLWWSVIVSTFYQARIFSSTSPPPSFRHFVCPRLASRSLQGHISRDDLEVLFVLSPCLYLLPDRTKVRPETLPLLSVLWLTNLVQPTSWMAKKFLWGYFPWLLGERSVEVSSFRRDIKSGSVPFWLRRAPHFHLLCSPAFLVAMESELLCLLSLAPEKRTVMSMPWFPHYNALWITWWRANSTPSTKSCFTLELNKNLKTAGFPSLLPVQSTNSISTTQDAI